MRIFKKKFNEELTEGMSIGECIITKVDDTPYGNFVVHRKMANECFPYLGCFGLLQEAIEYVTAVEKPDDRFEYYLQSQAEMEEGWDKDKLQVMGLLGWELCGIQSNITDEEGRSMFIYKRRLPLLAENKEGISEQLRTDPEVEYTMSPRVVTLQADAKSITYCFGKNGQGVTDELLILGGMIKDLSKRFRVYLSDPYFDTVDDVYYITVNLLKEE